MFLKGYLEGYYGRLLSWQDRSALLKTLSQLEMNMYIYGPKEDPYHRIDWFKPYPDNELENFKNFKKEASKLGITPYFSLSPGLSYGKDEELDLENLKKKYAQLQSVGFKDFAIFFDDIESDRDEELGKMHGLVMKELSGFLEKDSSSSLMFCPTVYCNSFANDDISNSPYLKGLSETVPNNLPMLWTGKQVVSQYIDDQEVEELHKIISNPIVVWDNYYANDYCPTKFYVGSYRGRNITEKAIQGIGLNLTGLPLTDSINLYHLKGDMSTEEILKEFGVPQDFNALIPFFDGPFKNLPELNSIEDIQNLINLSQELCVNWKSPLQLEWSPYLWDFFNQLHFLKKIKSGADKKTLEAWASRRYSGPLFKSIFIEKNKER